MNPYVIHAKLYSYDFADGEVSYKIVDFYFKMEDLNGFYISDEEIITIIMHGQSFDIEFQTNIYKTLKHYFTPISLN